MQGVSHLPIHHRHRCRWRRRHQTRHTHTHRRYTATAARRATSTPTGATNAMACGMEDWTDTLVLVGSKKGGPDLSVCILCSSQHLRTPASVVSPLPLPAALAAGRGPLSRRHHPLHARRRGMVARRFERLPERPRHPAALLACPRARPVDRGQQVRHGPGGALEGGVGRAAPRGEERLQLPRPARGALLVAGGKAAEGRVRVVEMENPGLLRA
mmetsp:Transcript_21960/g.71972  ORF Transcript_21960/g.71972 Transcript_21960/m.71972 type:complete len:214 (+) Transcript_21960:250-891(+)